MTPAAAASAWFAAAVERERLGIYGVHVRIGADTASVRWRSDDRENIYSLAKGVCAIAVGIAIEMGYLTLDTTAGEMLPEFDFGPGAAEVSMRRLLTMTSGIDLR